MEPNEKRKISHCQNSSKIKYQIVEGAVVAYGNWIYNNLCNQCLSLLMLWVRISIRTRCTTLCDKVCQWCATGRWFSPGPPVSSTNKTDRHDIAEILLKVALNNIKQTNQHQTSNRRKRKHRYHKHITISPLTFLAWYRHFNKMWRG